MLLELPHGFKRWSTHEAVKAAAVQLSEEWRGQQAFQARLLKNCKTPAIAGFCAACGRESEFSFPIRGDEIPNWRESLVCPDCRLINRWRASVHVARMLEPLRCEGPVYVTEQTTPMYDWLQEHVPELIGSEFVSPDAKPGQIYETRSRRIRHEDATALSMADASLSMIQTYDVLEHVPDYRAALREFARVLKPEGLLLLTAPFMFEAWDTVVRARVNAQGDIEHLLPAVYHGDPMSADGVLCFQEFGWDLLDDMRSAGFAHAEIITCWAPDFGYLGSFQPFVVARR
ncbi:MAG: methyltransferase domain-containing protein [Lysobacterales bacterium]